MSVIKRVIKKPLLFLAKVIVKQPKLKAMLMAMLMRFPRLYLLIRRAAGLNYIDVGLMKVRVDERHLTARGRMYYHHIKQLKKGGHK